MMRRFFLPIAILVVGLSSDADEPLAVQGVVHAKPDQGVFVKVGDQYLVPYLGKIPGTDITFEMIPVPGSTFLMGSPADEANRKPDEGPQVEVKVAPMWVGKLEVTQREYREFELLYEIFVEIEDQGLSPVTDENLADAVTAPTPLYDPEYSFEWGEGPKYPAVSMTQFAAQQYTKWLSAITECQYRLPTEAEWEYACRANSKTAYSWGNDTNVIGEYAWYFDNTENGFCEGGLKKPNAFGLYDMHGNVGEWTVNAYTKDGYPWLKNRQPVDATAAVRWPKTATSCVVRGGAWEFDAVELRSAARLESDDDVWKDEDPMFPQSIWWFAGDPARSVGFRLFRSYVPIDGPTISKYWDHTSPEVKEDLQDFLNGGRGKIGILDEHLVPRSIEYRRQRAEWAKKREMLRERVRNSRPE